jgi:hypothetical protein
MPRVSTTLLALYDIYWVCGLADVVDVGEGDAVTIAFRPEAIRNLYETRCMSILVLPLR